MVRTTLTGKRTLAINVTSAVELVRVPPDSLARYVLLALEASPDACLTGIDIGRIPAPSR